MDLLILANAADDVSAMETVPQGGSPEDVYEIAGGDSLDFDSWISLISEIEKNYSDNIKAISSVYDSFLSWFPLCHEYWKRYADHMARLCTVEKAVEIFEQAVQSATYTVGLWVDYCSFSVLTFADPSDVRRIFERGLSFVGKDFLCHRLWDLYIKFELSQQQWSSLAHIIIRAQKFPSKSLHKYYDSLKEFAAFVEEDMSCAKSGNLEPFAVDSNIQAVTSDDEISIAIKELQDSTSVDLRSKALNKFIAIGERFYNKSCKLHEEIDYFENYIDTDFYNVKPLDDEELQNWHNYLDFIEKQEDFDWAVKLYERCLIPCANYPEFWMRYVEFMESKGGRELANFALERATQVFLKNVSEMHIFNARFREKIGDVEGARAAFHFCDTESDSSFIETAIKEANMETRLGHMDIALEIYDKALKVAAEKEKMHIFPTLYLHFFRLKFLITGSADAAMEILIAGIQQVPYSRLLLEELINFAMMHEGSKHLDVVDSIIATAITCESDGSEGLSSKDREDLSKLYLKFVDYCGTAYEIRKAWNRHIKYFPHLIRSNCSQKSISNRISNEHKEPRKRIPRLVAKQPSRVQGIKHISLAKEKHRLLASKHQLIEPHKPTTNQYRENDDKNSAKENFRFQHSGDNSAGELEGSKRQSENVSQNELHVLQNDDEIRTETEEEHECEVETSLNLVSLEKEPNNFVDTMNPTTANQNPFPATNSSNKQTETYEHETDPQQISSQDMETGKTTHILSASEHMNPASNFQQPHTTSSASHLHVLPRNIQSPVQHPVQSSEQYNQMWQYQNHKQQQQQQNQQQWLQMQQSYQQQQSYIQQQQQLQPQHYQFYQQQLEQYQQYWFQMYQQQQQQQQQQLQEYNMQMQQYHQNPQHQIATMSNQMWNGSYEQQGQGAVPPHTTSTQPSFLPHVQQNPANVVLQQMAASAPTNMTAPSTRQQSSRSLHSPSLERTLET